MLCKKFAPALCQDGVYIYAIGGNDSGGGSAINDSQAYNVTMNKWYQLPPLKESRYSGVALIFNKKWVYTMIGCANEEDPDVILHRKTIERLDISVRIENAKSWETLIIPGISTGNMYKIA